MPRPYRLIDARPTEAGMLELRQRGEHDVMISIAGRVLMTSARHQTERRLGELACAPIAGRATPRILTAGLGLGFTLRAILDAVPASARVRVAELNPIVIEWCRGPIAPLSGNALADPRVDVVAGDVMAEIERARDLDAIVLDLYVGPGTGSARDAEPLYGIRALERVYRALSPGGMYAVWGEERDAPFERRVRDVGFSARTVVESGRGSRHAIYLCMRER